MIKMNLASDVDGNRFMWKESNKGVSRPIGYYIEVKWSCYFLVKIAGAMVKLKYSAMVLVEKKVI